MRYRSTYVLEEQMTDECLSLRYLARENGVGKGIFYWIVNNTLGRLFAALFGSDTM